MSIDSTNSTQSHEPSDESQIQELLPLLLKCRWAAWIFVGLTLLAAVGSMCLFYYQLRAESDAFGSLYREQKGSWIYLFGHLVRAFICTWLALRTLRYLRQLQRLQDRADVELMPLFLVISRSIKTLGWCCLTLLCYGLLMLIDLEYGLPSIPLKPRSSRMRFARPEALPVNVAFHEARFTKTAGWTESFVVMKKTVREPVFLNKKPILETADIQEARPTIDERGNPALILQFTKLGSLKLAAATEDMIGNPIAIVIDDVILSVPLVREPLSTSVMLTGEFTEERVRELAESINGTRAKSGPNGD